MSGDSSVEEVYRRRSSVTSHEVDLNFGVRHPNLNFWVVCHYATRML